MKMLGHVTGSSGHSFMTSTRTKFGLCFADIIDGWPQDMWFSFLKIQFNFELKDDPCYPGQLR